MTPQDIEEVLSRRPGRAESLRSQKTFSKDSVAIRRWMAAGCFDGGLNSPIIPEDQVDPNQQWALKSGTIGWKDYMFGRADTAAKLNADQQANATMFQNQLRLYDSGVSAVYLGEYVTGRSGIVYLATYIYSRADNSYLLITEYPDCYKILQNGQELFQKSECTSKTDIVDIRMRHGWNLVMVKLVYHPGAGFYAGLCDRNGNPFTDGWVKSGFMLGDDIDTQMFAKNPDDAIQAIEIGYIDREYKRTNPDSVVYIPAEGPDHNDGDNEHFLVCNAPCSEELIAIWTQGSMEPSGDNHIVTARSEDGIHWSKPTWIYGTRKGTKETQASWGFPVVASKTGRIYCFYCESPAGRLGGSSGVLGCHISDDNGLTWEKKASIRFPDCFTNPRDVSTQNGSIIVWQLPIRDSRGRQIVGYTFCGEGYPSGCCRFLRFDNIDDGPEVDDLEITWLSLTGDSVSLPDTHCSEPSVVLLPDGRLFVVFRTALGRIGYSVSEDDGVHWRPAEILRDRDQGEELKNPLTCCPIYPLEDDRYLLLFYNNSYYADLVREGKSIPGGMSVFTNRRPLYHAIGHFRPGSHQPICFDPPMELMDNQGVLVSPKASNEIATYPSMTYFKGKRTLWYPDRKFFLLGKHLEL